LTTTVTSGADSAFGHDDVCQALLAALRNELLAVSGTAVVWPAEEPYLRKLVEQGGPFRQRVRKWPMAAGRPEMNTARLWGRNVGLVMIVVGYARYGDVWKQHYWALRGNQLLETAEVADDYYGVGLDLNEAFNFYMEHFLNRDHQRSIRRDVWKMTLDLGRCLQEAAARRATSASGLACADE